MDLLWIYSAPRHAGPVQTIRPLDHQTSPNCSSTSTCQCSGGDICGSFTPPCMLWLMCFAVVWLNYSLSVVGAWMDTTVSQWQWHANAMQVAAGKLFEAHGSAVCHANGDPHNPLVQTGKYMNIPPHQAIHLLPVCGINFFPERLLRSDINQGVFLPRGCLCL